MPDETGIVLQCLFCTAALIMLDWERKVWGTGIEFVVYIMNHKSRASNSLTRDAAWNVDCSYSTSYRSLQ